MLYPAMSELLKHVDSRYLLVNVVAHRARQLSIESEMTHEPVTARAHRHQRGCQRRTDRDAQGKIPQVKS